MEKQVKQKILMLTDWYEPGFKAGGPVQACKNVVDCLKEAYTFYILCSDRDHGDKMPYPGVEVNTWIRKEESVNIWYASKGFMGRKSLLNLMQEIEPDFVYFNSMYSFKYTLYPLWILLKSRYPGKIILAPRGMLHKGALRDKYFKKRIFLEIFSVIGWSKRIIFQATDEQERKDIKYFFTEKTHVEIVEDIPTLNHRPWSPRGKWAGRLDCIFLSRIHPKKNLHYFLLVLKDVGTNIEINFDIYGTEDHPDYGDQCKKIVSTLPKNIKVRFMGGVTFNKVFDAFSHYHLFILPTLGENYGHAIFEALTSGLPVLISDQTPWRNLEQDRVGWDIPLSDRDKFAEVIIKAAAWNQEQYNDWSGKSYQYAKDYMHELNALSKYKRLFSAPDKKVILIFTDWYEPGYKAGGPIQSCRNIVNMLEGDYEFYIVCSDRDLGDKQAYKDIPVNEWVSKSADTKIWYASPNFINGKSLKGIIETVRPDFVYFNSMYSPLFTLLPLWILLRNKYSGKIVLAPRGMLHKGALKRKYFKKYVFLRLFRVISWHKKVIFHATDAQEKKDISQFFSESARITVLENIPITTVHERISKEKKAGELNCVYISRIHPKKNLYYFLEILSGIPKNARMNLDVYGMEEDTGYAQDCRQLSDSFEKNIRVSYKGPIPHQQVISTIQRYHLFVLPSLGENFGHAIYEALSAGDPVLISDQTPWRNLEEGEAGWDIPLDDMDKFKDAIEQALAWDQDEYDSWSEHAFQLARSSVDIPTLTEKYKILFG